MMDIFMTGMTYVLVILGTFFLYVIFMSVMDHIRAKRRPVETGKNQLSNVQKRQLEKQLELMDPWYPDHDDWMDPESRRLSLIVKERDPILYIQTKLQHWLIYQENRKQIGLHVPNLTSVLSHNDIRGMNYGLSYTDGSERVYPPTTPVMRELKEINQSIDEAERLYYGGVGRMFKEYNG